MSGNTFAVGATLSNSETRDNFGSDSSPSRHMTMSKTDSRINPTYPHIKP